MHAHSSHCHVVLPSWLVWSCLAAFCLLFVHLASILAGLFDRRVLGPFCLIFLCLFGELPSPFAMLPRHTRNSLESFLPAKVHKINFCVMIGHVSSFGSPCPATEWTLCLFATFLDDSLRHSSIKVYLSALRPLHVDQGFPTHWRTAFGFQELFEESSVHRAISLLTHVYQFQVTFFTYMKLIRVWTLTHLMIINYVLDCLFTGLFWFFEVSRIHHPHPYKLIKLTHSRKGAAF